MVLHIDDPEPERLAGLLGELTGESTTEAVKVALRERLARIGPRRRGRTLADDLDEIALHCASLPVLDDWDADEIIGYDGKGLPD